jgi:single-strand DNA-binding protein
MQVLMIAGNVGNVKEVRDAAGDRVLNFSLAVDNGKDKNGEKRDATWFDCAIWGKRADALAPHITKGSKLALTGKPGARAHEGKAHLSLTVNDLTFMGGGEKSDSGGGYAQAEAKAPAYSLIDDSPF